jgi:hypothetical protein
MEWYLCKKEHENHIYHYLKSGTATTEPRVYGGRFSPNTCPNMIGYIVRSRLNVYDMVSGYGRYQFEDMNTVKEFCNYIGTIVYPDTNNSTTIDYIKTHFGQYQW